MGMTETSNEQIFRAIGNLEAEVKSLRRDIQQSESRADTHRAAIHRRVDDVAIELGEVRLETVEMKGNLETVIDNMKTVKDDLAETKAVTEQVKAWKLMGMGALGATGLAAGMLGSVLTYFASDIARWWRGL